MTLLERILDHARTQPDAVAHRSAGRTLTYAELAERSGTLAAWLEGSDAGRAPLVVRGHKEPEMLVAFLAAMRAGRPYVPIDATIPEARAERIIGGSGAKIVLMPERVGEIVAQARSFVGEPPGGESLVYILFTSGSTGEPKGVMISQDNLAHFVGWMVAEQGFGAGEVFLNQAPFSFDLSVMDLYPALVSGGTLFSITKEQVANPKQLYAALAESGLTTWVSTPSFANMCLVEKSFRQAMLPSLRRFLFCGETLSSDTAKALLERFPEAKVWNTYGPTEATVACTSVRVTPEVLAAHAVLPVGAVMPGSRVVIVGENGEPMPEGERGELIIAGPGVSAGYLGRADLTERAFFRLEGQPAYRTGDWGRVRGGQVFFEGRMDGQVKLNGFRIELGDIEAGLRALEGVADAVVLPVEKNGKLDSLAACIAMSGARAGTDFVRTARLKTALAERLPAYMVPRKFLYFDTLPMTTNGKVDRKALALSLV